jgi:hypothetical protein
LMVLRRPCITGFDRKGTGSFQPPLIRRAHVLNEMPAPDPLRRQGRIEPPHAALNSSFAALKASSRAAAPRRDRKRRIDASLPRGHAPTRPRGATLP